MLTFYELSYKIKKGMYGKIQMKGFNMKAYIREHLKIIVIVTALIVCTCLGIASPVIIAKMQPILSEELKVVSFEMEKGIYEYTGKEIKPELTQITFENAENEKVIKNSDEFSIKKYIDNKKAGQASVEISVIGYQGSIVIEDVFTIRPAKASGLQIASVSREVIELKWDKVIGAESYSLFRSVDGGQNYTLIADGKELSYRDTNIQPNAVYQYYVCVSMSSDNQVLFGEASDIVKQYTPLETPVISAVKNVSYNTLRVEWPVVAGATGYQVYRSDVKDGEYTLISEITDGATTSHADTTCECGKTYYYYIKACQTMEEVKTYGDASAVVSGKTTPNLVGLSGSSKDGNTKVTLSWKKVSGAQGYEVYKNNKLVKTIENADTLTWSESGLAKDAEHSYKVRAYCVINNEKLYGSYSKVYEKEVTIEYNYGAISEELSALTKYVGYSYVFGGTSPTKGWDCSGFTQYVFNKHFGISLPRTSGEQAGRGTTVSKNSRSSWKPGDLLFYKEGGRISHVAIYLGNGQIIHALNSKYDTLIQGVDYYEKWDSKTTLYCVKRYF